MQIVHRANNHRSVGTLTEEERLAQVLKLKGKQSQSQSKKKVDVRQYESVQQSVDRIKELPRRHMERINLLPSLYLNGLLQSFESQRTFEETNASHIKIGDALLDPRQVKSIIEINQWGSSQEGGLMTGSEFNSARSPAHIKDSSKNFETADQDRSQLHEEQSINPQQSFSVGQNSSRVSRYQNNLVVNGPAKDIQNQDNFVRMTKTRYNDSSSTM